MDSLPTTAIGLIAFVILTLGVAIKYMADQNTKTTVTFMTYIEKKNGIVERLGDKFIEQSDKANKQFQVMLEDHDARHKQMMDDMAARVEAK